MKAKQTIKKEALKFQLLRGEFNPDSIRFGSPASLEEGKDPLQSTFGHNVSNQLKVH